MKTVDEILQSRVFYKDKLIISEDGFKGFLVIDRVDMSFVASWDAGWDHVSVAPLKKKIVPTWEMMCKVKDLFFKPDEAVIQIHPPKDEYVNNMPNCLHLWRCRYKEMVLPPSCFVGIRKGQSAEELLDEIRKAYEMAGELYD